MSAEMRVYLVKLATDPKAMRRFMDKPDAAMSKAGLPDDVREAMVSGDIYKIHALVSPSAQATAEAKEAGVASVPESGADATAAYYYQSYLWWLAATTGQYPASAVAAAANEQFQAPSGAVAEPDEQSTDDSSPETGTAK